MRGPTLTLKIGSPLASGGDADSPLPLFFVRGRERLVGEKLQTRTMSLAEQQKKLPGEETWITGELMLIVNRGMAEHVGENGKLVRYSYGTLKRPDDDE